MNVNMLYIPERAWATKAGVEVPVVNCDVMVAVTISPFLPLSTFLLLDI